MEQLIVVDRLRGLNSSVKTSSDLSTLKYGGICFYNPRDPNNGIWSDGSKMTGDFCIAYGSKNWDKDAPGIIYVDSSDLTVTRAEFGNNVIEPIRFDFTAPGDLKEACEVVLKIYNRKTINTANEESYTVSKYYPEGKVDDLKDILDELQLKLYNGTDTKDSSKWQQGYDNPQTMTVRQKLVKDANLNVEQFGSGIRVTGVAATDLWAGSLIAYNNKGEVLHKNIKLPDAKLVHGTPEWMFELYKRCAGNKGFTETDSIGRDIYAGYIKTLDDVKREWFSNANTKAYGIITLRFRNKSKASKTLDESVYQLVHIAFPADKFNVPGWIWTESLFDNYKKV